MSKTCIIECSDNLSTKNITVKETKKQNGTTVSFIPDYERFGVKEMPKGNLDSLMFELLHLGITYPGITFSLNKDKIKVRNFKDYCSYYGDTFVNSESKGLKLVILPNETDNFKFVHFVNSLNVFNGGEINNWVTDKIVDGLLGKLTSKYKGLKKGDIKNKLFIVSIFDGVFNPRFGDQIKSICTNKYKDFQSQIEEPDWDKLVQKILKTPEIIDPIVEVYKLKEELKKRQDMKGLEKPKKKIVSEKYTKPVGNPETLLICEGKSASSALLPGLGRKGLGYYELKGKPLNAYSSSHSKFTQNTELTELYQIIKQEGYTKFGISADADLDGIAIVGLLLAFAKTYLNTELSANMFYMLRTPIGASKKNKKIHKWVYNVSDMHTLNEPGCTVKYYKGLGSWVPEDMKAVLLAEGLDKMLVPLNYTTDDDQSIDDWYSDSKADKRKEFIQANEFDLIKL